MAPRWTGMCSACMTIWPWASNSAVEASRRSLMLAEWALRTSTTPISSQAARSAPSITWSVTGSMSRSATLDHQRSVLGRPSAPARRDDQRRLGQLDDGRAGDLVGGAAVDARIVLVGLEIRLPGPFLGALAALAARQVRARQRHRDADRDELQVRVVVGVAVALV